MGEGWGLEEGWPTCIIITIARHQQGGRMGPGGGPAYLHHR